MNDYRPVFVPFDEKRAVRIYKRSLPHWRQDGATYFVTFRLTNSIPKSVQGELQFEQVTWLKSHNIEYDGPAGEWRQTLNRLPEATQFNFHKHFNRQVQSCLDRGLGDCWLRMPIITRIVREKLLERDRDKYHLGDFIMMPNHVHCLITPAPGIELEAILKNIKGGSAVECNRSIGRGGAFWQADSYDHIVRTLGELFQYRQYIESNPGRAKITVCNEAYYSARWMDGWF